MTHECERLVQQIAHVDSCLRQRARPGVIEKVSDDAVQSIRLAQDNLHQFGLR
jgi:hypothetical protein